VWLCAQARQSPGHAKGTDEGRPVQRPPTEGPTARMRDSLAVTQLRRIKARAESHLPTEEPTARTNDSPAVTQLKCIKARAERRLQATR
jgi:hypothetical protein